MRSKHFPFINRIFFNITTRHCCALHPFLKPHWYSGMPSSIHIVTTYLQRSFWIIFEIPGKLNNKATVFLRFSTRFLKISVPIAKFKLLANSHLQSTKYQNFIPVASLEYKYSGQLCKSTQLFNFFLRMVINRNVFSTEHMKNEN